MGKVVPGKGFDVSVKTRWYLLANRVTALIYTGLPGQHFKFVKRIDHPMGKLPEIELINDRPGRASSAGPGVRSRHGFEPRTTTHEEIAQRFARDIAKYVDRAYLEERFKDLVVMAEPHFLGLLHKYFTPRISKTIKVEIPREWSQGSDQELEAYLAKKLAQEGRQYV